MRKSMIETDWKSKESLVFASPHIPEQFLPHHWEGFESLSAHIWIATSGTTQKSGAIQWVACSKEAFLVSAQAVNTHLDASSSDIWLNSLPLFHVGGLSIFARSYLSGAQVKTLNLSKWCKTIYFEALCETKASFTSLVPTQLYDLVEAEYHAPSSLKAVIVGGGALSFELFQKAKSLRWPVLPTFGMSECCSQVATAKCGEYDPMILPHMDCTTTQEGLLQIKSQALFSGYLKAPNFSWIDPKVDGAFTTQDRVEIKEGKLYFLGRQSDWIKIGGENVSLFHLETLFNKIKSPHIDAIIHAASDQRLGMIIQLVALKTQEPELLPLIQSFNAAVMPYEKIRHTHLVDSIPRTPLGKPLKGFLP